MILKQNSADDEEAKKLEARVRKIYNVWNKILSKLETYPTDSEAKRRRTLFSLKSFSPKSGRQGVDEILTKLNRIDKGEPVVSSELAGYKPAVEVVSLEKKIVEALTKGIKHEAYLLTLTFKEEPSASQIEEGLDGINIFDLEKEGKTLSVSFDDKDDIKRIKDAFDYEEAKLGMVNFDSSILPLMVDDFVDEYEEYPSYLVRQNLAGSLFGILQQVGKKRIEVSDEPLTDIREILEELENSLIPLYDVDEIETLKNVVKFSEKLLQQKEMIVKEVESTKEKIEEYKKFKSQKNISRFEPKMGVLQNKLESLKSRLANLSDAFTSIENIDENISNEFKSAKDRIENNIEKFQKEARDIRRAVKTKIPKKIKSNPEYNKLMSRLINKIQLEADEIKRMVKQVINGVENINDYFKDTIIEDIQFGEANFMDLLDDSKELLDEINNPTYTPQDRGEIEMLIRQIYRIGNLDSDEYKVFQQPKGEKK